MTETAVPQSSQRFVHHGRAGELLAISLVNLLYKVLTLGVYHFWAKTRVRRYVWSQTSFAGERFEYTGQGRELLLGLLRALVWFVAPLVMLGAPVIIFAFLGTRENPPEFLEKFSMVVVFIPLLLVLAGYPYYLFLLGLARYGARRYRLGRTRWRGIRFALAGSAVSHGKKMLGYSILTAITFGIYFPYMRHHLTENLLNHTWFGDQRLSYGGRGGDLVGRYWGFVGLTIAFGIPWGFFVEPVLSGVVEELNRPGQGPPAIVIWLVTTAIGLLSYVPFAVAWLWFRAGELRYYIHQSSLANVRFTADFRTTHFIWLWISNAALVLVTLGLAYSWAAVRTARFFSDHLHLRGELDFSAIGQSPEEVLKAGEGLAEALDLGSI